MNKQCFFSLLIGLLCLFLLANGVLAMSSPNYRLDWFVPLTGNGGPASSAHYAVNLTVGQTAAGFSASPHYRGCLGYWCSGAGFNVYLPVVIKN